MCLRDYNINSIPAVKVKRIPAYGLQSLKIQRTSKLLIAATWIKLSAKPLLNIIARKSGILDKIIQRPINHNFDQDPLK